MKNRDQIIRNGELEKDEVNPTARTAESLLRLVPVALCVAAFVVMFKNSESFDLGSVSYSSLEAFSYLVVANGICAAYSLLSALVVAMPRTETMHGAWTFFLLDQMFTCMILAAAAEVLYMAYKGDSSITWSEACSSFSGFCHNATGPIHITFIVVVFYAVLSLISSYRLFSQYDAPTANRHAGIEIASTGCLPD